MKILEERKNTFGWIYLFERFVYSLLDFGFLWLQCNLDFFGFLDSSLCFCGFLTVVYFFDFGFLAVVAVAVGSWLLAFSLPRDAWWIEVLVHVVSPR